MGKNCDNDGLYCSLTCTQIVLFLNTFCVLGPLMDSDVFVGQLTEQCSMIMKELQSVQAELLKAAEQQRRAERERDDLMRESQRLEDTVCRLEREKEELSQVKEELGYSLCLFV